MPFLRKRIISGNVIEVIEYFSLRVPNSVRWPAKFGEKAIRGKNRKISSEQQRKLNNRNAVNHLCRILNANFKPEDFFLTLDLATVPLLEDGEPDENAIKKLIAKYTRRLHAIYQKAGKDFRYVWVIEKETPEKPVRPHVHMIVPAACSDDIMDAWTFGGCAIRRLYANDDYRGIANYLSKDPTRGVGHKKRWGGSKNLVQPVCDCRKISRPGGPVKTPIGYKEIFERSYVSDVTGMYRYMRFVKMFEQDVSGYIITGARAGPDPIPIETG